MEPLNAIKIPTLVNFRLCTLSDEELVKKARELKL